MTNLLTAAQMRAIEQAAIDSGEVTGLELMERAGVGVVEAILEWQPDLAEGDRRAAVLCGPGNNGGDGFVVARLLNQRGWTVEVFLYGDEAKLPPDAAENARRWREMGQVSPLVDDAFDSRFNMVLSDPRPRFSLVIDALFGIGLTRPVALDILREELADTASLAQDEPDRYPIVAAIDTPSGLCANSGRMLGTAQQDAERLANLTITFQNPKVGHLIADGPTVCGELAVVDLGLDEAGMRRALTDFHGTNKLGRHLVSRDALITNPEFYGMPETSNHKYSHGHAVIVSGGMARTGAARLAARGALRVGAGLVTIASPPSALMENAAHLTAIMLQKMKGAEGLSAILSDDRINAVVIGPGCGVGTETRALVEAALSRIPTRDPDGSSTPPRGPEPAPKRRSERTVILDADALTSFADDPAALFAAVEASPCSVILTPHGGEFGRLFPDLAATLAETPTEGPAASKIDATREAAARSGATVLYKGPDTVIADPRGRCSIAAAVYDRAAPWLATAGSGDVLAGMIAGLAARGVHDPAGSGAWLHQECGRRLGPGLIAEDLPEALPAVLKSMLNWQPPT